MRLITSLSLCAFLLLGSLSAQDTTIKAKPVKLSPERQAYYDQIMKDRLKNTNTLQSNELINIETINDIDVNRPVSLDMQQKIKLNNTSKKPATPDLPPNSYKKMEQIKGIEAEKKSPQLQSQMTQLPESIRYIAEFEEMQAVMVSIPCTPYGYVNEAIGYLPMFMANFGNTYYYVLNALGKLSTLKIDTYYKYFSACKPGDGILWPFYYGLTINGVLDTHAVIVIPKENIISTANIPLEGEPISDYDTTAYVWANLIHAIQEADGEAWIRMTAIQDTTILKDYMAKIGMPLKENKYRFFNEIAEDAFWVRDWGPHGFYYNDNGTQKLGFNDAIYYPGRPYDDKFSRKVLTDRGYDYYPLDVQMEGGNIMTDGYKSATYGDVIYINNSKVFENGQYYDPSGPFYYDETQQTWVATSYPGRTKEEIDGIMKVAFSTEEPNLVQSLKYDGGTGHIDLWIKQFDEETMLIANMPEKYSVLTDYKIIQQNREYLNGKKTCYGTNYRFLNAPMPRRADGPYPTADGEMPTTDAAYNRDPRGYLNGLLVNKSYIYPSFSRKGEAGYAYDSTQNEVLKKLLPGYNLVPIDARSLTPGGGAIHCITMQIPAEKVVTIKHKPVRDNLNGTPNSMDFSAELVSNNIDEPVDNLLLKIRKVGTSEWQDFVMALQDVKYSVQVQGFWADTDTIEYYIEARHGDAVKKTSPIVGAGGAYKFWFKGDGSIDELYGFEPKATAIASIYPNPASEYVNIIFENMQAGNISIEILNSMGQVLLTPVANRLFEKGVFTVDITSLNLNNGAYYIKMTTDKGTSISNFIISK